MLIGDGVAFRIRPPIQLAPHPPAGGRPGGANQGDDHGDFLIPAQGKAVLYGVYDLTRNAGWVSVGIDHDTASFAVGTIGRRWQKMGRPRYRRAHSLLITADGATRSSNCAGRVIKRRARS